MDKKYASSILEAALALDPHIGALMAQIDALPDSEEKTEMSKATGDILKSMTLDIIFPILKQYPELDPDRRHSEELKRQYPNAKKRE